MDVLICEWDLKWLITLEKLDSKVAGHGTCTNGSMHLEGQVLSSGFRKFITLESRSLIRTSLVSSCSSAPLARYMAAFAPGANGLRMIGLGLGLWTNNALVKAISREGGKR